MASVKDKAKDARLGRKGEMCGMERLRRSLKPSQWRDIVEAMDDPIILSTAIGRVLREDGHRVSDATVQRHRRGACQCPR